MLRALITKQRQSQLLLLRSFSANNQQEASVVYDSKREALRARAKPAGTEDAEVQKFS